jgi:hypothetical protein
MTTNAANYADLNNWFSIRRGDGLDVLRSKDSKCEIRSYRDEVSGERVYDLYYQRPGSLGAMAFGDTYQSNQTAAEAAPGLFEVSR